MYIEIEGNKVIHKTDSPMLEGNLIYKKVTKEIYDLIELPCTVEMDEEGNVITVTPLPKPEPEPELPEPTIEAILLEALLEIQALKGRVEELEGR